MQWTLGLELRGPVIPMHSNDISMIIIFLGSAILRKVRLHRRRGMRVEIEETVNSKG